MKEEPDVENLNAEFLEAYKSLDKLCKEIYRSDKGVTSYIDDMDRSLNGRRYITNWDAECSSLLKLQKIRNRLSHEPGTMYMNDMCSKSDIEWLRNFHERILKREDPIALMRKIEQSKKTTSYATPKSNPIQKSISVQEPRSYSRENFDNIFEIQKRKQLRLKTRKTVAVTLVAALITVLIIIGIISIIIK